MVTKRVEVRFDEESVGALSDLVSERRSTISEVMREAVRRLHEEYRRERRRLAVERIAAMEIEEMPDPEELSRQMASTYDVDLP
jgi:Arc/MetJ-type ribon-helix-helix transcriptional regulator